MITTNNPEALRTYIVKNGHGDGGHIKTRDGVIDENEWPDTYPALTKVLIDQAESEYKDTSASDELLRNTDSDLARILEDAMDYLKTVHNIDIETNLSTQSKDKLRIRREARQALK